ncbi:MAG TPA: hypothetical protein VIH54_11510 [Chthoniobacterales bacterium]
MDRSSPFSPVGLIEALCWRFGYRNLKEAAGSWVAMGFEWCCAEAEGIGGRWCVVRIRIVGGVRGGKLLDEAADRG